MYTKHFGLTEEPFSIAANPRFLYMSASHREALAHLLYGISSDSGFVLLTGEVGTGKTTVCRCLLEQLPEDTEVAFILNPKVSAIEMLSSICGELGITVLERDCSVKKLVDAINHHLLQRHADGRKTVVIIDEAQNLGVDVLEQLRLLTNLETNERKLMRIILIGQPELATMLARPELKQVEQRITARYHLRPLLRSEIGDYVSHRLAVAGRRKVVFPSAVLPKLYAKTEGIPRLINVICDRAMLGAYVNSQSKVNASILDKAAREVQGRPARKGWLLPGSVLASILLVGAATAAVLFYDNGQEISMLLSRQVAEIIPRPDALPDANLETLQEEIVEAKDPVFQDSSTTIPKWPDQIVASDGTLRNAQSALFKQWNIPFTGTGPDPCELANDNGLHCFSGTGNLGSLIGIDRPAILTLVSDEGRRYHATLLALNDDMATLAFAHGIEVVTVADLEARWQGRYHLLWHLSPDGHSIFRPGDRGVDVIWLTESLLAAGINSVQVHDRYDSNVIEAVRAFQLNRGLLVDGVAGRQTLIHLSSINGSVAPRLAEREGD